MDYLRRRGTFDDGAPTVRVLAGGVSSTVLAIEGTTQAVVVKQPLAKLRVPQEWAAKRERAITEGEALTLARRWTPDAVPAVHDIDRDLCVVTLELAPADWRCWKQDLLEGKVDVELAADLGRLLGCWHRRSSDDAALQAQFSDHDAFEQLRVSPYYRTAALRLPEFRDQIEEVVDAMLATSRCLVHGDFSPKNILVGPHREAWVLDFEVAHFGDPTFDVAFLLSHLCLKAIHRPDGAAAYLAACEAFWSAYHEELAGSVGFDERNVSKQLGCLIIARVVGKSPVEYLDAGGQRAALRVGGDLLTRPPAGISALFTELRQALLVQD
ncbi:MAG: aminoglycoside phosphotransferase family protein [Actinobacteria bacterium]|nr:aminoglycoside phosphotransferase family protein [Actinomycetota bacterium]